MYVCMNDDDDDDGRQTQTAEDAQEECSLVVVIDSGVYIDII